MNLLRSGTLAPESSAHSARTPINIYHLHPLVAGPLETWPAAFARIGAMGFSHVCLAPPFEPCSSGDIFVHASFDRLHPALRFDGPAEQGIERAVTMAQQSGLRLMLDIAPGQVAIDSPLGQRHPDWFGPTDGGQIADPRRKPHRIDVAVPRFDQTVVADAVSDWWIERLTHFIRVGVAGFRCLSLDLVPPSFWRRITAAFPETVFLAWTPGLTDLRDFAGIGFDLTCSSAGHLAALLDQQLALRAIAPPLVSPEPSFLDRLTRHLSPDADIADSYRLALGIAVASGSGLFLTMGFEYATSRPFDASRASPADMEAVRRDKAADLSDDIAAAIRLTAILSPTAAPRPITSPASNVIALLRSDTLVLINPDIVRPAPVGFSLTPLPGVGLSAMDDPGTPLRPGEVRVLQCRRTQDIQGSEPTLTRVWAESTRIAVQAVEPESDYIAKTVVGREFTVSADIFGDGHDVLAADLLWQPADGRDWQRLPMRKLDNDRWQIQLHPDRNGLYRFAVEGWWDQWATFTHDLRAKIAAGQDVTLEIQEGRQLVTTALRRAHTATTADELLSNELKAAMSDADTRPFAARSTIHTVRVDRPAAEFASWYELFPRSATHDPAVHGTFRSVIERLPDIRTMGFDVLYFPPIHPIGRINRKGRNNNLRAAPDDVGSPYAIGSAEGGHDAIHPALGTLDDFLALVHAARENDLEIAIDFAIQCAPDHPWVTQHKDWFRWRPDGSMRYAENPPKKYEDIVNPDFYGEASFPAVWTALRDVVQFWVDQGVRIFRVDNPHTKPLPFWQWMIADIQARHPDVLFLAEAFTRPKPMYRLAKLGFSQSYTYFTWRNTKAEIVAYMTELTTPPVVDFFRPNFFVNTPDINPVYLQTSGRAGFLIRMVLAATLSGLWGVYSGFEICEAAPLPGREEYLDSEKYEIRPRDYAAPNNIVAEITALNRIRRRHPALQSHRGLAFYNAFNDQIVLYGKRDPLDDSMVLVAVSLDPHIVQEAAIEVPLWEFGLADYAAIAVTDLMNGESFMWHGKNQHIRLDPAEAPFRIWRLEAR
jgi:starch synthase (maltosyl-transferring)